MALPETDLHRIRVWARARVPEHLWDQVKVEADVADRHVAIVEVRPPWNGVGEHTRKGPSKKIQSLLDYMESRGDPISWG